MIEVGIVAVAIMLYLLIGLLIACGAPYDCGALITIGWPIYLLIEVVLELWEIAQRMVESIGEWFEKRRGGKNGN